MRNARRILGRNARGFSLIEAAMSTVIVGVMLTASLRMLGGAIRTRAAMRDRTRAVLLARRILSEVQQQPLTDPNVDSGETRTTFDDVDDYDNLTLSPPTDSDGTAIAGYTNWSVLVRVAWADPTNPAQLGTSASNMRRITVTVTSPGGRKTILNGLRSQYGLMDKTLRARRSYAAYSRVTIQVGTDATTTAVSGINPLNQVP
jgi:MSHA pilin protein MshD